MRSADRPRPAARISAAPGDTQPAPRPGRPSPPARRRACGARPPGPAAPGRHSGPLLARRSEIASACLYSASAPPGRPSPLAHPQVSASDEQGCRLPPRRSADRRQPLVDRQRLRVLRQRPGLVTRRRQPDAEPVGARPPDPAALGHHSGWLAPAARVSPSRRR